MQLPLFLPESSWRPPSQIPNLGKRIALDVETYDPHLKDSGPSFKRGAGFIAGFALADEHTEIYFPVRHQGGDNLDRRIVKEIVQDYINQADEIIMHNCCYDLGWLFYEGFKIPSHIKIMDTMVADALIDEEQTSYSLDNIAYKYLKRKKNEELLRKSADAYLTANKSFCPKKDMWRLPARYVGTYAEQDARLTFDIYPHQLTLLQNQNLIKVWELECRVSRALVDMTRKGCPVDLVAAEKLYDNMQDRIKKLHKEFNGLDIWSGPQLAKYCDNLGIEYPTTEKNNPSITKEFLSNHSNDKLQRINELRGLDRLAKTFVLDTIIKGHYKGRIHCDFKQTASDEGGTRSGRLSASNPNLTQVPSRSEWGKQIRKLYVPESGTLWCKSDYSQQEPRLAVHYAILLNLEGAEAAAATIRSGQKLYKFFEQATGLPYDTCKMLYLGILYGMGIKKMADVVGVSESQCSNILDQFHSKAPFLRGLFDYCMGRASKNGYVRTILGRRSRFEQWSSEFGGKTYSSKEEAIRNSNGNRFPTRAFTSKALNRVIQGSAADMTKTALATLFEEGYDIRLSVHDELDVFVKDEKEAQGVKEIMEQAIQLKVPVVADIDLGTTWK